MNGWTRRRFIGTGGVMGALWVVSQQWMGFLRGAESEVRRLFTLDLVPGAIGVGAGQRQLIDLAARHGFESVEPQAGYLAGLEDDPLTALQAELKERKLVWGATGLPVDFRGDESSFQDGLGKLPRLAAGLERAGAGRIATWLSPAHNQLAYGENFKQHARRLREVARILSDHGIRFGLEYVGTERSRRGRTHEFVHTMKQTRELIAAIDVPSVGLVLDSWHWWTAGDTAADILALQNKDVVAVDLNDAPAGLARSEQIDNQRELPAATGVIPVRAFLDALLQLGYDGPVRAEPFNQPLNELDNEQACAATIQALRRAVG